MADKMILVDAQQNAAQTLAAEISAKKEAGIDLHETQPGGYFIGTDGEPHDAEGKPIKKAKAEDSATPKAKGKK